MKEFDINTESDNIIKKTSSDDIDFEHKESVDVEEVDQDKLEVKLKDIKAEYNSVTKYLPLGSVVLEERDIFDVVKFTLIVEAQSTYKWDVYHRPSEIRQNFQNISNELNRKNIVLTGDFNDMFNIVQTWTDDGIQIHISEVENFYKNLFLNPQVYNTSSFKEFFNISLESFNQNNSGSKPFEGFVYKKADPTCLRQAFSLACYCIEYFAFAQYNLRYFIVKDDLLYYKEQIDSADGKNTYFFDKDFDIQRIGRDQIEINNSSLTLVLKFKTVFEREIWYNEINTRAQLSLKILKDNKYKAYTNEKTKNKAHWFSDGEKYFADLAQKLNEAQSTIFMTDWWMSPEVWLVRPVPMNSYMSMAYQNKNRKESPPYSRLMDILYQCANRGVKVYIQVYAEMSLVLTLNSAHTKDSLTVLHPNIRVIRHPLNSLDLLWSHHEKLVIIDQIIGYVGGLDLCWGRYDTNDHPINEPVSGTDNPEYLFPGIDYSNARIRDFDKVGEYLKESSERGKEARMPWHDVHCRIIGPAVADIARHFVQRWNFSKVWTGEGITDIKTNSSVSKEKSKIINAELKVEPKKNQPKKDGVIWGFINKALGPKDNEENNNDKNEVLIPIEDKEGQKEEKKDENNINNDNEFLDTKGMKLKGETKLRGKKKLNLKKKNENITEIKEEEKIDIINTEENNNIDNENINININTDMNQAEEEKVDYTQKEGYDEMQRINEEFMSNKEEIDGDHLYIKIPDNDVRLRGRRKHLGNNEINNDSNIIGEDEKKPDSYLKLIGNIVEQSKKKDGGSFFGNIFKRQPQQEEEETLENVIVNVNFFRKGIKSKVQVLRSASLWSVGIKNKEDSILQAYYYLIKHAKHYIYIENQFFVSRPFSEEERKKCPRALSDVVENLIAYEIKEKILERYRKGKKFRVFIFIPLLPGFAGEPESSGTLQIILKHTYGAICRNHGTSIIEQLQKEMGEKWKDYIGFYSLRNHGIVNGVPTTEIIYIHSKLMIVDDRKVILGSANINDRSMLGTRDSEFCVLIREKKLLDSKMDGKDFKAANFAHSFRRNLFAEHVGLDPKDPVLNDPLSDEFLKILQNRAEKNTLTYRELWGCYPDDEYKHFKDIKPKKTFGNNEDLRKFKELYESKKGNIEGHVVQFPLHFLEKEQLGISFFSKENLVPEKNFT